MTDRPAAPGPCTLTDLQATRVDYARRDFEAARAEELADLPPAGVILVVERLRRRLDDMLQLVAEISDNRPPDTPEPKDHHP
ncbi:hypothetical protein [Streptomyces sp. NPDC001635]